MNKILPYILILTFTLSSLGFQSCQDDDNTEEAVITGLHLKDKNVEEWVFLEDSSAVVTIMFENNLMDSISLPLSQASLAKTKTVFYDIEKLERAESFENAELILEDGRAFIPPSNGTWIASLKEWDDEIGLSKMVGEELRKRAKEKLRLDQNEKALSASMARVYLKQMFYRAEEDASGAVREYVRMYDEGNKGRAIRKLMKLGDL